MLRPPTSFSPLPKCFANTEWSASLSNILVQDCRICRSPIARRSRTCPPSMAQPAASFRSTRRVCAILKLTGRGDHQVALVEAYAREQGLFHDAGTPEAEYSELLSLDLATVEPSLAGPKRPQDRVLLSMAGESFTQALPSLIKPKAKAEAPAAASGVKNWEHEGGNRSSWCRRSTSRRARP